MAAVNRGNTEDLTPECYVHLLGQPFPSSIQYQGMWYDRTKAAHVNTPKGPDMQPFYWLTALLMVCLTVGYVAYITH